MAKSDTPVTDLPASPEALPQPASALVSTLMKFRDKVYTSRQLILPESQRSLPVTKGLVEVPGSDTEAVKFLKAHDEFELLKE
ncbi:MULTISPECIES: hypothetical protein [unclassified Pseudomonas]|uniref:hypothetical protein n=1 Tax=unclassified Pseudomonas TaxID=196821 RepID=UPI000C87F866|nr:MULTISPECIES: hypothetical protein [unclassified Pseudomonas]PMZ92722.1 hypothetical protein C1X61_02255 [Pseudomonas sp. FW215-T2]PNA16706.1 hypothetical protein C1X62_01070 [Pseudomonas sp. FW215-R3]PNB39609.1 hypothetical protein C1X63_01530 [Pseudomonas sp. FW305-131]